VNSVLLQKFTPTYSKNITYEAKQKYVCTAIETFHGKKIYLYSKVKRGDTKPFFLHKNLNKNTVLDVKILQRLQFYLEEKHNNYKIQFTKSFLRLLTVLFQSFFFDIKI
jgi:hypothetical protein